MREKSNPEKKFTRHYGEKSLPLGWKTRITEGESEMSCILSPEGRKFRTRYCAVQDKIKREQDEENVKKMKEKMIDHEGWEKS